MAGRVRPSRNTHFPLAAAPADPWPHSSEVNPMTFLCWSAAIVLSVLLAFVSYVQLLYLESLRLLRRETPALEHFREELSSAIKLDNERGSLSFSLIKHIS